MISVDEIVWGGLPSVILLPQALRQIPMPSFTESTSIAPCWSGTARTATYRLLTVARVRAESKQDAAGVTVVRRRVRTHLGLT